MRLNVITEFEKHSYNVLQVGNLVSMRFESFYIVHDFNEILTRI